MKNFTNSRKRKMRTWAPGEKAYQLNGSGKDNVPISLIDLASNDYLGLANNLDIKKAFKKAIDKYGVDLGISNDKRVQSSTSET